MSLSKLFYLVNNIVWRGVRDGWNFSFFDYELNQYVQRVPVHSRVSFWFWVRVQESNKTQYGNRGSLSPLSFLCLLSFFWPFLRVLCLSLTHSYYTIFFTFHFVLLPLPLLLHHLFDFPLYSWKTVEFIIIFFDTEVEDRPIFFSHFLIVEFRVLDLSTSYGLA